MFAVTEHDFGGVLRGQTVVWTVRLHNAGDLPLELAAVRFSMAGMTARVPGQLAPGGDAAILLEWTPDRVQGRVRVVAVVETNDPRQRSVPLVLTGTVHGPVDIEPIPAVFLSAFQGEDVRRELTLRSNQPGLVTLHLQSHRGAHHVAELENIQPGRSWRLTVKPAPGTPPGRYKETLEIESGDPAIGNLRLPVFVFVKADLYANPDEIDFGEVPLDRIRRQPESIQFLKQIVLVKKREGSFQLRGIRSDVAALQLRATPSASESGIFRIDAGLSPEGLQPGSLEGTISIDTDDPQFPRLTVRVRGRVVEK